MEFQSNLETTSDADSGTVDQLQAEFIALGGNPNLKTHQEGELRARNKALAEIAAEKKRRDAERGRFSRWAAAAVKNGLEFVALAFTLLLVVGGLLIGICLLVAAEIAAVQKGFVAIDANFAPLYSISVVTLMIVVMFIREIIAGKVLEEPQVMFSLRYVLNYLGYFMGFSKGWQVQYKRNTTLLTRVDSAIKYLIWTVVIFGLLGRLTGKISGIKGNWVRGIVQIVSESDLSSMLSYIGATLMTLALLTATHFVVYFVYKLYERLTAGGLLEADFFDGYAPISSEALIELETEKYWRNEVLKLQAKNQQSQLQIATAQ